MTEVAEHKTESKPVISTAEDEEEENEIPKQGCGTLGRHPVMSVLLFAIVGICVGVGLSCQLIALLYLCNSLSRLR